MKPYLNLKALSVVLIAGLTIVSSAQAGLITFDTANYSSDPNNPAGGTSLTTPAGDGRSLKSQGNLSGGSNDSWNNYDSSFAVVDGAGVGGTAAVVTSSTAAAYVTQQYTPTASEWGNIPFNAGSTKVDYSIDLEIASLADSFTGSVARIALFGSPGLLVRGSGQLRDYGGSSIFANDVFTVGVFHTISGQIDYAAGTFTVFVDGVLKKTVIFTSAATDYGDLELNMRTAATNGTIAVDNISFVAVAPEPASGALALLGLGGLALLRRRHIEAGD